MPQNTRNLLDFNEMAVDSRGRIVAVYADGCHTVGAANSLHPCMTQPDNDPTLTTRAQNQGIARLTILRQRGGLRLFGAFDTSGPPPPPPVIIRIIDGNYKLTWATPDDGNSPITAYRIYRGTGGGKEQLIGTVSAKQLTYIDRRMFRGDAGIYYKVTAVNAYGESPRNIKFFPSQNTVQNKAE